MATSDSENSARELDSGMMVRRALFLLLLIGLGYYFLILDFRGISHEKGMDQAQIAREIARGNGFTTKAHRPAAFQQIANKLQADEGPAKLPNFLGVTDTYHSPLNPLLNSILLGMAESTWKMGEKQTIYTPDIIIAGTSMVLLLASIGITYLLVSRIFDPRIGGVTALLMLLCESLWRFSQSGLPQMLMLFLFSFATYFLYKTMENIQAGRPITLWMVLTAGFFGLLAWSHWLTVWIFLGLIVFVALMFPRRFVDAAIMMGVYILIVIWWPLLINMRHTGNPLGAGVFAVYTGLGGTGSESALMRDLNQSAGFLNFQGFFRKMASNSIAQIRHLYDYLGGIIAAPLFFLSLLHPFRRKEIADFRWCILSMWIFAVLGMTLYTLHEPHEDATDPNNLHILFIPLMAGYGLAFLSVLWNRLNVPLHIPIVRNMHFILAVAISALPFVLNAIPRTVDLARSSDERKFIMPYVPRTIAEMGSKVPENEVVVTDMPWAVAWYMDRSAMWLPKEKAQLDSLRKDATSMGQPMTTLLLSPLTLWQPMREVYYNTSEWAAWREYMMLIPASSIGRNVSQKQAIQAALTEDMIYRYPAMSTGAMNVFYLFMKDNSDGLSVPEPRE